MCEESKAAPPITYATRGAYVALNEHFPKTWLVFISTDKTLVTLKHTVNPCKPHPKSIKLISKAMSAVISFSFKTGLKTKLISTWIRVFAPYQK